MMRCSQLQADTRIPCPNDPKHTCYSRKLKKHLSICNARPKEQPPYIVKNINCPDEYEEEPVPPVQLSDIPSNTLDAVVRKISRLFDEHLLNNIVKIPEQPIHPSVLEDFSEVERTERSRRHLRQVSSLLWLAEAEGLVQPGTCYIELGAGKGKLSYYAWNAWCGERGAELAGESGGAGAGGGGDSRVLLIDRASHRHKLDNKLKENEGGTRVSRVRADLADVQAARVPVVAASPRAVGFAKHLCGAATDYALLCMLGDGMSEKTRGIVLATCCHHRCRRDAYVGSRYLRTLGIKKEDFAIMLRLVSWATCGDGRSRDQRAADDIDDYNDDDSDEPEPANTSSSSDDTHQGDNSTENAFIRNHNAENPPQDNMSVDDSNMKKRPHDSDEDLHHAVHPQHTPHQQDTLNPQSTILPEQGSPSHQAQPSDEDSILSSEVPLDYVVETSTSSYDSEGDRLPPELERQFPLGYFDRKPAGRRQVLKLLRETPRADVTLHDLEAIMDLAPGGTTTRVTRVSHMSRGERAEVGRRARALLDWGRVLWLRALGFRAKLCYYVPRHVSPENVCIVAKILDQT